MSRPRLIQIADVYVNAWAVQAISPYNSGRSLIFLGATELLVCDASPADVAAAVEAEVSAYEAENSPQLAMAVGFAQ